MTIEHAANRQGGYLVSKQKRRDLVKMIYGWLIMMINCFVVWLIDERHLALFLAGTIVRDPHYNEFPTRREHDLNMCRT